jgi:hypothetical protein
MFSFLTAWHAMLALHTRLQCPSPSSSHEARQTPTTVIRFKSVKVDTLVHDFVLISS